MNRRASSRPAGAVPDQREVSDIVRRHELHVCEHHPDGVCVLDGRTWPCDTRLLLNKLGKKPQIETSQFGLHLSSGNLGEMVTHSADECCCKNCPWNGNHS